MNEWKWVAEWMGKNNKEIIKINRLKWESWDDTDYVFKCTQSFQWIWNNP